MYNYLDTYFISHKMRSLIPPTSGFLQPWRKNLLFFFAKESITANSSCRGKLREKRMEWKGIGLGC